MIGAPTNQPLTPIQQARPLSRRLDHLGSLHFSDCDSLFGWDRRSFWNRDDSPGPCPPMSLCFLGGLAGCPWSTRACASVRAAPHASRHCLIMEKSWFGQLTSCETREREKHCHRPRHHSGRDPEVERPVWTDQRMVYMKQCDRNTRERRTHPGDCLSPRTAHPSRTHAV